MSLEEYNEKYEQIVNRINAGTGLTLVWGRLVNLSHMAHHDLHKLASISLNETERRALANDLSWNPDSFSVDEIYLKHLRLDSSMGLYRPSDGYFVEGEPVVRMSPVPHLTWSLLVEHWRDNKIHTLDSNIIKGSVVWDYFTGHPAYIATKKCTPSKISSVTDKYAFGPVGFYIVP